MFGSGGGFGSSGSGGGGFGGFGQSSQNKPASSFGGAFGQSSNTNTGFGSSSNNNTTSGFGRTTGGFGSTTSAFGGSAGTGGATTGAFGGGGGFGSTGNTGFGSSSQTTTSSTLFGGGGGGFGSSVAATGTERVPYASVENTTASGKREVYNQICAMDAYKGFSPEELRLQDYEAGRNKKLPDPAAATTVGGFGQASGTGFGQTSGATGFGQTSGATGFGQTSGTTGFGQASGTGFGAAASKPSGFGGFSSGSGIGGFGQTTSAAASTPAFGQAAGTGFGGGGGSTGGFGSTASTGFGGFGSSGTTAGATGTGFGAGAGTGAFGQSSGTTGGFGSSTGFGAKPAFGSGAGTGAFGAAATSQPAASTGFGQSTGGFGQSAGTGFGQSTGGFGQTAATGGGGLFGSTATSAAPAASTGLFGSGTAAAGGGGGLFGSKPAAATGGSGLFGSSANSGAAGGGGMFGSTAATNTGGSGMFGASGAGAAAGAGGGGLFGSSGGAGGSLFGAKPAASTGGGGLFGASGTGMGLTAAPASTNTGGGLFGASGAGTSTGGGLFGAANTGAAPAAGGGLFGSSGAGTATGGGLFGSSGTGATAGTGGGGLFGSSGAGAASTGGGFGFGFGGQASAQPAALQQPQPAPQQSQLFAAQQPALQAGQLAAQIDKQPYGVSALFDTSKLANKAATKLGSSHLTATPLRASVLSQAGPDRDAESRKRGLNLQRLASPHVGSAASSRLRSRGFAAPTALARKAAGALTSSSAANAVAVPRTPARREVAGLLFGRDGFLSPESQLPHSNVKRLVITRKPSFGSGSTANGARASGSAKRAGSTLVGAEPVGSTPGDSTPVRERATTCTELLTSPPHMDNPWAGTTPAGKRRSATAALAEEEDADDAFAVPVVCQEDEDEEGVIDDETGGYWMRPSLEDLRAMSTQQLRAVRNFTVGCEGIGQVSFNRPVDLTSVGSLSAIAGSVVLFDDRVCTVYPDESNKPPRGQGLNVPATISLHACWPVDRASGAAIEHMDDPRVRKHIRRLRRIDETEFVDFVDGTWIFRVEHFSRYGLDDNQEDGYDEEDAEADHGGFDQAGFDQKGPPGQKSLDQKILNKAGFDQATAAPADRAQGRVDGSRAVANEQPMSDSGSEATDVLAESSSESIGDSVDELMTESVGGSVDESTAESMKTPYMPPPRQLLLGGRHAASLRRGPVMRASLFSTTTAAADNSLAKQAERPAGVKRRSVQEAPVVVAARRPRASKRRHARRQAPSSRASSAAAASTAAVSVAALDLPHPSKYLRASESRIARSLLAAPQPYERSLTHGRSGMSADAGLVMARSFRVAFGPQGQLVYLQGRASSVLTIDNVARHVHAAESNAGPDASARYVGTVRAQWEHSVIDVDASGSPHVSFRPDTSIASVLAALRRADSAVPDEELRLLELAAVLFDDAAGDCEDEHVRMVRQRQSVTQWLMGAVYEAVQRDLLRAGESGAPAAAAVFALLSGHRIEAACLAATAHRDYRLATLIAQSGSGGNDAQMQALVRAQLGGHAFADKYRRVYEVLAGAGEAGVAAGLDWKRAFGLGLWYAQSPADSLALAVRRFESAVEGGAQVAPPLPAWLFARGNAGLAALSARELREDHRGSRAAELYARGVYDPVFQLLRLFAQPAYPLERALPSESFTPARGDSRQAAQLAWLLLRVRRCRGFDDSMMSYDRLLAAWASQLEVAGLWQWACFVLLQLSSVAHREHAIRALLERALPGSLPTVALMPSVGADLLAGGSFASDAVEEQLRFVLQELRLPRAWLFAAYATRSRYDRDWAETHASSIDSSGTRMLPLQKNNNGLTATYFGGRLTSSPQYVHMQQRPVAVLDTVAEAILRQFAWLMSAGQTASAHALALQRIAPDAVLRGEYAVLRRVLEHLSSVSVTDDDDDGEQYHSVPSDEWAAGGQVYLTYIAAIEELPVVLASIADSEQQTMMSDIDDRSGEVVGAVAVEALALRAREIYQQMVSLLAALPLLLSRFEKPDNSVIGVCDSGGETNWYIGDAAGELYVKHSVAVSEMASMVTGFIQELGADSNNNNDDCGVVVVDAASLPLAQDMRILRTFQLAKSCFGSLVSNELQQV